MAADPVRMWRAPGHERVLLMAGRTTRYAIEPRGEYVFGVVDEQPMRSLRGRKRRLVRPGQLVFPHPVIADRALAVLFERLHAALDSSATRLERDERLAEWLREVIERHSAERPTRSPLSGRDDRALRLAFDYLAERFERNVGLDELASAAGIGKFRLIRLFRERTGLPPHALQIAHRIRAARRLLEAGEGIADTAFATGFADQSHMHRHFQRSLGLTPARYQQRFRG